MKMKRFIAGLLSLIMVISMTGVVDVNAAETTDSTYGELLAEGLTEGTYADVNADPNEDYVYTVVGSDGSVAEVTTDTTENVVEGYWKVQWEDGTLDVENGEYLIVSANLENSAVKSIAECPYGTFTGSKSDVFISADNVTDEIKWNIAKSNDKYTIESYTNADQYMKITAADANGSDKPVTISTDVSEFEIIASRDGGYMLNAVWLKHNGGYLNYRGNEYVGTWGGEGTGNCFYLYKQGHRATDSAIAEVTAGVGTIFDYASGWTEYREALLEVYTACGTAAEASAEFEALIAAKDALEIADTKTVYKKYTGALPTNGNYLIVTDRMTNYALGNTTCTNGNWGLGEIAISENKTTGYVAEQYVWAITQAGDVYNIQNKENGKYINIASNGANGLQWSTDPKDVVIAFVSEDNTGTFAIGNTGSVYMNCYRQPGSQYESYGMGTYSLDGGGYLYLYKETVYVTNLAIAKVESSVTGTEDTYTTTTWNAYQEALVAAKAEFATEAEASEALATLRAAAENLDAIDESVLDVYYVKTSPSSSTPIVPDGIYAIVGAHIDGGVRYSENKAINNDGTFTYTDVADYINGTKLTNVNAGYEWTITNTSDSGNTYHIQPANNQNKYIKVNSNNSTTGLELADESQELTIKTGNAKYTDGVCIGNTSVGGWFNHRTNPDRVGTWTDNNDTGGTYYLYRKQYAVPADVIAEIEALNVDSAYPTDALATYQEALAAAQTAKATSKEAYEAYKALVDAVNNLSEVILPAEDPNAATDVWVANTSPAGMKATLTLDGAALAKTTEAITFDLTTATGFELLASCGSGTGMLMAVVKNSDGTTARAYLVDTYYPGQDAQLASTKVPVVRDMASPEGGYVEVYGCLVASVLNSRAYSMRSAANTVSTEDIVLAALQELGLDDELSVSDVTVSYMDESSVLNGGMVQGAATYAVNLADTTDTTSTTGDVIVEGCRVYREGNNVDYTAVSDLVTGGDAAFITENEGVFVLTDYQKTGPQNEIYLDEGESLVIGLDAVPLDTETYEIRVKVDGVESYRSLDFVEGNTATIPHEGNSTMALSIIRKTSTGSEVSPAMFMMSSEQTDTVLARLNAGDILEKLNPFVDVEKVAYYYDAVLWAVKEQITDGWTDTLFAPDMGCTRGQVVTFLWRAAGMPEVTGVENPFTDVTEDAYYYDAVLWAVKNGITDGWTDTLFAPEKECTRGEIVTFLWRAAGEPEAVKEVAAFVDLQANAFYEEAVLWAVENGITEGVDETHFEPENTCLRGQIVTFLYRAMSENK